MDTTMMFLFTACAILFVVCLVFLAAGGNIRALSTVRPASTLPDHNLNDLLPSQTASKWTHSNACDKCHSPVGHEEFMTKICLTCGRTMNWPRSNAYRSVVRHGSWVRQVNAEHPRLELRSGMWLTPVEYDKAKAPPTPPAQGGE